MRYNKSDCKLFITDVEGGLKIPKTKYLSIGSQIVKQSINDVRLLLHISFGRKWQRRILTQYILNVLKG